MVLVRDVQGDSALKAQYLAAEMKKYRPTGPTQQELMKIFHTTRHVFDPKFVCLMILVDLICESDTVYLPLSELHLNMPV